MKNSLLTDHINYTLTALMFDLDGLPVLNEKKFMDLIEYALNNNIVIYGGGCGASKIGMGNPQGDKKGSSSN